MTLNLVWYGIITFLTAGFLFLEGADYGVGILLFILGKREDERQQAINTIGPFWDGNEVWLVAAGGAMFAAFPILYAVVFSAFYIPLVLVLFSLIVRGVAFVFRGLEPGERWQKAWDAVFTAASLLTAFLAGLIIGTLVQGLPIDAGQTYRGGGLAAFNPLAILTGVAFVLVFALHGAIYLLLKADGVIVSRAQRAVSWLWLPTAIALSAFLVWANTLNPLFTPAIVGDILAVVVIFGALLLVRQRVNAGSPSQAFWLMGIAIVAVTVLILAGGLPTIVRSTLEQAGSLDVQNAASSHTTLRVMGYVAAVLLPIIVLYQIWVHYLLRGRVSAEESGY